MFCRSVIDLIVVCIALQLCFVITRAEEISTDRQKSNTVKCLRTCSLQFRCYPYYNPDNEPNYALENGVCKVFANGCVFASKNCNRQNSCLPVLVIISKEKCIEFCPVCDTVESNPICAIYRPISTNDSQTEIYEQVTYQNQCFADREACLSGKPYAFITEGICT